MSTQQESVTTHENVLLWWRNGGRESYAVVASITRHGEWGEWAAYLGRSRDQSEEATQEVATYGAKLSEDVARAFSRERFGPHWLAGLAYRR